MSDFQLAGRDARASGQSLKRALKLRDLILLNIVAVYTPGTLSQTLPLGGFGLLVWAAGLAMFLLPYAAAIADLSARHPHEGGVYTWTRMALGRFHGFVCGWCYWVNTFLYVPSVFLSMAAVASLLGGDSTAWLNNNPFAATAIAGGALWLAAALHIVGLGQGKWIQNAGAFGRLAIAAAILGAALWKLWTGASSDAPALPALDWRHSLALWPFALNALVGLDLGSAMSEETGRPSRDIPRSLLIGGVSVAACYLLTYGATLYLGVAAPDPIYGHVQAINSAVGVPLLATVVILIELFGLLGCGASWLAAPARIPFAIGLDRYLPKAFGRVHPRFGTPYVALIVQAVVATGLIFVNTYGATLKDAYLALLGSSIVLVMVTYIYLFWSWLRLQVRASVRTQALAGLGLLSAATAIVAGFIPPQSVEQVAAFELKIVGSVGFMLFWGLVIYALGRVSGAVRAETAADTQ
jgi:glutamate:GABA antiporter